MPKGSPIAPPIEFETLNDYLEAVEAHYNACMDHVQHDLVIDDVEATLRFHHLRFDGNGEPKFSALAQKLVDHIIYFCIASRQRHGSLGAHEYSRLFRQARDLFRKEDKTGEPGELLLYFLLETVLKAPQVVCKMSLKTNRREEVKGSDGIHVAYDEEKDCIILYLGEAKLYQGYGDALTDAFQSIGTLHSQKRVDYEIELVTSHFKHVSSRVQEKISEYLDTSNPTGECRICHACLIGYDWTKFGDLRTPNRKQFVANFKSEYLKHCKRLAAKTSKLFDGYACRHLSFEIFFVPFQSVAEFRAAFKRALLAGEE
jgi:Cap4 SAVED domain